MTIHSSGGRIGVIGIGSIGFPIAERLLRCGHPVTVHDIREEAVEAFVDCGGDRASDPRAVGERCDNIHIVVANDDQAEAVIYGDDGLFAGFDAAGTDADRTLVVHSTLVPETVVGFADAAPDGVAVLDAPVSNTQGDNLIEGRITVMVGGDESAIERYRPVLETIATEIKHIGPVGAALATKLANNAIHHAAEVATFEALELATSYGVPEERFLEVIRSSSGNTYFAQNFDYFTREVLLKQPENPRWFAYNIRKNLRQALELADHVDEDVPLIGLVSQECPRWFKEIADDLDTE